MKEVFKYYKKYLAWLIKYNRLVKARNTKKQKAWDGRSLRGPELEEVKEPSLLGFLKWGAKHETS
jgi:hypothetical protein